MRPVRSLPPLPRELAPLWLLPGFLGVLIALVPTGAYLWMQGEAENLAAIGPFAAALWFLVRVAALYLLVVIPLHEAMHWVVARARGYQPRFTVVLYGRLRFPCPAVDSGPRMKARDLFAVVIAPQALSVAALLAALAIVHAHPAAAGILLCATAFNFGTAQRDLELAYFAASHDAEATIDIDRSEVSEIITEVI